MLAVDDQPQILEIHEHLPDDPTSYALQCLRGETKIYNLSSMTMQTQLNIDDIHH